MGTLILTDALSVGDNLEYMDMLTVPVLDGLKIRINAFCNIDTYEEPNGLFSASLLQNMPTQDWDAIGRNSAMSGGVRGGGIIIPATDSELNGRPYLDMIDQPGDSNTRGRFYLIPAGGRAQVQGGSGYTIFFVGSIRKLAANASRFVTVGQMPSPGVSNETFLQLGITGANDTYFFRVSRQGETYVQGTATEVYEYDTVKVFAFHYNPVTGAAALRVDGAQKAAATVADKGDTAWDVIGNLRVCGNTTDLLSWGSRGKFADFMLYDKLLTIPQIEQTEAYLKALYGV